MNRDANICKTLLMLNLFPIDITRKLLEHFNIGVHVKRLLSQIFSSTITNNTNAFPHMYHPMH